MLTGEIHNARKCTINDTDHWIATVMDGDRIFAMPTRMDNVLAADTLVQAINLLRKRLRQLNAHDAPISVAPDWRAPQQRIAIEAYYRSVLPRPRA